MQRANAVIIALFLGTAVVVGSVAALKTAELKSAIRKTGDLEPHHRPSERPARPGRDRAAQGAGATAAQASQVPTFRACRHAGGFHPRRRAGANRPLREAGADRRHHAPLGRRE